MCVSCPVMVRLYHANAGGKVATKKLIRHGSETGYKAELAIGVPCSRCKAAHTVYNRQFTKAGKQKGLKYTAEQVIDNLAGKRSAPPGKGRATEGGDHPFTPGNPLGNEATPVVGEAEQGEASPTLGDRLSERIRTLTLGSEPEYVAEQDTGYVHEIEDTDSMGPEWEPAEESEYLINAAGLKTIQENMTTYLSVIGITVEMIDPYCGPILAQNLDNIVIRWSKVVAHYPKAAELFMDGKGGVIFTWIGALQATWPVLYAIYQHHLAKTVAVAPNGQIYNRKQQPNPNGQFPDPLTPEFQYSAT